SAKDAQIVDVGGISRRDSDALLLASRRVLVYSTRPGLAHPQSAGTYGRTKRRPPECGGDCDDPAAVIWVCGGFPDIRTGSRIAVGAGRLRRDPPAPCNPGSSRTNNFGATVSLFQHDSRRGVCVPSLRLA